MRESRASIAAVLIAAGQAVVALSGASARAEPETCPTLCDQIPNSAWIDPSGLPLNSVYRWPAPASVAAQLAGTPQLTPRFRFEQLCATPPMPTDPREYAVAARAGVAEPEGKWQLQAQILHWRGDTWRGGQLAASVFDAARGALRDCQRGAPLQSPSLTTDEPDRLAGVISGPVIVHTYLVAHLPSSTVSELTLWSSAPPEVPWPLAPDDGAVLDALTAPLCVAYIGSCQR